MTGRSGVGSGAAAAAGSAKTAPAASTVDALSISRLESLLSRMLGPAACGLDATTHFDPRPPRWEFGENAARYVECRKGYYIRHLAARLLSSHRGERSYQIRVMGGGPGRLIAGIRELGTGD